MLETEGTLAWNTDRLLNCFTTSADFRRLSPDIEHTVLKTVNNTRKNLSVSN